MALTGYGAEVPGVLAERTADGSLSTGPMLAAVCGGVATLPYAVALLDPAAVGLSYGSGTPGLAVGTVAGASVRARRRE